MINHSNFEDAEFKLDKFYGFEDAQIGKNVNEKLMF